MIENFKGKDGRWVSGYGPAGKKQLTTSYSVWNNIKDRCKPGGRYQTRFPSYVGCTMSELFSDFQSFTDWHMAQIGYGLPGYALDKDLLNKESKLYSEDTCVLVPEALNSFYVPHTLKRDLPQGVYLVKGKYRAAVSIGGKLKQVGLYECAEEAWLAYKVAKESEAKRWANRLEAGEYVVDSRVISALRRFIVTKE